MPSRILYFSPASKPPIRYRLARLDDLDELARLEGACFPGNDMTKRQIRRHILNPLAHFHVAVDPAQKKIAGYSLVLHHLRRGPRLYSIAVARAYRGMGIGKKLLRHSMAATRSSGAPHLMLEVSHKSRKAQSLYREAGFTIWKEQPDYYGDGIHAFKMVKRF